MRIILLLQAQYLLRLEGDICGSRIVNNVLNVTRINHECNFSRQVQFVVFRDVGGRTSVAPRIVLDVSCVTIITPSRSE